ncbi:MAG: hypothetical protein AB1633_00510 [Elusimicrobiota bacterium]
MVSFAKRRKMFEKEKTEEILLAFLEKKATEAKREIEEKGILSDDKAIPLLLKTQFNHIAHLDEELSNLREIMDRRFEQVDKRFEQMENKFNGKFEQIDRRFEQIDRCFEQVNRKFLWVFSGMTAGFTVLSSLITLFRFIK